MWSYNLLFLCENPHSLLGYKRNSRKTELLSVIKPFIGVTYY